MGLHAKFIRNENLFVAKYAPGGSALTNLDNYCKELGFAGYLPPSRFVKDGDARATLPGGRIPIASPVTDSSFHPVCHGFREIAERRLLLDSAPRARFDISVELFAGKRQAMATWGTYPQIVTADAARLADASYPITSLCGCLFPAFCAGCKPRPGSSVLVVDVYALEGEQVEAYLREHNVTLLSLQWLHPVDQYGYLGATEMYCTPITASVYNYAVPANFDRVNVGDMYYDEYFHGRWLNTFGADVKIVDVYDLTDPLMPDRAVYTLVRIEPVARIAIAPGMTAIERETLEVIAYPPEKQRGTLMRTLVREGLVTLDNAHDTVEAIVKDLAHRASAARSRHTPLDSVRVGMSEKLQKDASLTSRLPLLTVVWLWFVSLPLRLRLVAFLALYVCSNLLLLVTWSAYAMPAARVVGASAWHNPLSVLSLAGFAVAFGFWARQITL